MKKILFFFSTFLLLSSFIYPKLTESLNNHLFEAVKFGNLEQVKILVEKGANVNAVDETGATPLIEAADKGHLAIVKYLVSKGADVHSKDKYGYTALFYAVGNEYKKIKDYLGDKNAVLTEKEMNDLVSLAAYWNKKGLDLHEKGEFEKALKFYEKAAKIYPEEVIYVTNQAEALGRLGKFDDAEKILDEASRKFNEQEDQKKIKIELSDIYIYRGESFGKKYDYRNAIEYYHKACEIDKQLRPENVGPDLDNIADCYRYMGLLKEAKSYYEQLLVNSDQFNNKLNRACALFGLGIVYNSLGEFEKSLKYCFEALESFRLIDTRLGKVNTLCTIGRVYHNLNKFEKALGYYEEALTLLRKVKIELTEEETSEGILLNYIGDTKKCTGQCEIAKTCYIKSLEILRKVGDRFEEGNVLTKLGVLYSSILDYKTALNYFAESQKIFLDIGDRFGTAWVLTKRGDVFIQMQKYQEAWDNYEQALKILKDFDSPLDEAYVICSLGDVRRLLGEYNKAREYYLKASKMNRKINNPTLEGVILNRLGILSEAFNQCDKAIEYYKKSLKILQETGNTAEQGRVWNNIGFLYSSLHKNEKSIECFKQSLEVNHKAGNKAMEENALSKLGDIFYSLKQYDQSIKYFENFLELSRKINHKFGEAIAYNNLGCVYNDLGEYEKALDCHDEALKICRKENKKIHEANTLNNIGLVYDSQKQFEKSVEFFKEAINLYSEDIVYFTNLAGTLGKFNKFEEGETVLKKAQGKFKETEKQKDLKIWLANIYFSRAQSLKNQYNYQKAIEYFQKAYEIDNSCRSHYKGADLFNIAEIYRILGMYKAAKFYYEKCLEIARKLKDKKDEGISLQALGVLSVDLSQYDKGEKYYKKSLEINREINDQLMIADSFSGLSDVYTFYGQYQKSIDFLIKALKIYGEQKEPLEKSMFLNQLGIAFQKLGQYDKSINYFTNALEIIGDIENNSIEKAVLKALALNSLCELYSTIGNYNKAIEYGKQSLLLNQKIGRRSEEAKTLYNIGYVYIQIGQYKKAVNHIEQAAAISSEIGDFSGEAHSFNNLGWAYHSQEKYDEAIGYYKKAIKIAKEIKSVDLEATTRANTAFSYFKKGDKDKAIKELEIARPLKDMIRYNFKDEELKFSFYKEYYWIYRLLFDLYFDKENYEKAFEIDEHSKSVVFAEMIAKRGARKRLAVKSPGFKKILDEETELICQKNRIVTLMNKSTGEIQKKLWDQVEEIEQKIDKIQKEMKRKFPRYAELLYPEVMELQKFQEFLKKDETYVSFYLLEDYTILFIVTHNSFLPIKIKVGRNWIIDKIVDLNNRLKSANSIIGYIHKNDRRRFSKTFSLYSKYPEASHILYQTLFQPLELYISTKNVLISADGVLYGFPFEALITKVPKRFEYNGKNYLLNNMALKQFSREIPLFYEFSQMEYLGEKHRICYIPKASTLNVLRGGLKKERAEVDGVIAFVDPIFSKNQLKNKKGKNVNTKGLIEGELYVKRRVVRKWPPDRLPETAEEADIFMKQIGKGKIYKGLEATEENVWKAGLEKAKYVLFSTHGILGKEAESKDITEPALVLTLVNNPEGYDGLLGMTEAAGLRLNSDVVILSACNSGGESGIGGEGSVGMVGSFLFAGSQAVVASLWKVDTRATKMLIENYGKYLKENKGRLEALEAARKVVKNAVAEYGNGKRKIKVSYANPYFWAAFVFLGER